ncbi:adenosylcobinamide kinase/adenosylcobinamide-phosphate guanylyltransferase [Dysgonomonas hofstadii]|uniref:Adenosylcobinamide kinase n=1 Tax=Dysgonomonas hofstadii TaxID=637886 RepID=A0A840CLJ2_9BACT|nr:bifunctional adenosylcobinamide kinase/adenosylcobinamide-phosphate guanylyltransferase [Dysgonomonas hofstadii]MBB4034918.1 adenosylcobinamide kinase/adenosylcobinamide-phosphate guanylyltransferase [Dysgonomonas hofstadii]
MKRVTLITGGQRSGKSSYAEKMALSLDANPVYLATSRVWDEEHRKRIEKHKANRGSEWVNIEEDKALSKHDLNGKTILIDCVTLWATNFFFDLDSDVETSLALLKREFDSFTSQDASFIFVTNEIGMGEMPQNELQRKFSDLQGWFNQYIAANADDVFLMVSGIPVKVK